MRRRLIRAPRRGFNLIEIVIALAIMALLLVMVAPFFGDYIINSRLREGGHVLVSEALFAQSEAIKRNGNVRLTLSGGTLQVIDRTTGADVPVRSRVLPDRVVVAAEATVDFGSRGFPLPFPTDTTVELGAVGVSCSSEHRCPALRLEPGGAIRLCGDRTHCT